MRSQRSQAPKSGESTANLQILMCRTHMRLNVNSKRHGGMAIFTVPLGIDFIVHLFSLADYRENIASQLIRFRVPIRVDFADC